MRSFCADLSVAISARNPRRFTDGSRRTALPRRVDAAQHDAVTFQ
jgi:hypothetical protein